MKKPVLKQILMSAAALLLGASAVFALQLPGFGKGEKVTAANGAVSIPLSKVSDGKAHFYRFANGNKEIGFFIVKGADGAIHTAFDTCDVCFREKKGYVQAGNMMQCKNCGQKFAIAQIGPHTVGGCNPSYLPATQAGGKIVITANDLKAGARFF
ncbi:DUF2318 domain-containing protein [Geomonas sp. RF6]|uniref:DUF2318 domain-containing protein n=1 Tax=Geomonas sp. RF6 TaxID=2897342 RepID=UPI001E48BB11|nr:DUF2318 domain-containing protein [Geomonas sp. RF6]UFS70958.1 DUF2318 domain-containing protein [Geomonas sp. RF6]